MIWAVVRVMALELWRDRGALVLAFVLPSVIFAIFASIFSGATDGSFHVRVALAGETQALQSALDDMDGFQWLTPAQAGAHSAAAAVREGRTDVGLSIELDAQGQLEFVILTEPSRQVAAASLEGALRQALAKHQPQLLAARAAHSVELLVGDFTPEQQRQLDAALASFPPGAGSDPLLRYRSVHDGATAAARTASVAYYAGATAILFLMLAAMQAGLVGLEERRNGIRERLLLGPLGRARMVCGRFIFLMGLGICQAATIYAVARLGFALPAPISMPALLAVTVASSAASSGLALLLLAFCSTPQQAQTLSAFFVLIVSAVGGSMVPRYMMPEWLQSVGLATPNAWAIEGFYNVFARGADLAGSLIHVAILSVGGLVCLALAAFKPES